jgi:hypothetical protein
MPSTVPWSRSYRPLPLCLQATKANEQDNGEAADDYQFKFEVPQDANNSIGGQPASDLMILEAGLIRKENQLFCT